MSLLEDELLLSLLDDDELSDPSLLEEELSEDELSDEELEELSEELLELEELLDALQSANSGAGANPSTHSQPQVGGVRVAGSELLWL